MAVESDTILRDAARILSDVTNTYWDAATLIAWLNEAQAQIAVDVPGASTTSASGLFVTGPRQSLPDGGISVLQIDGLRKVDKKSLDRENPAWMTGATDPSPTMWMPSVENPREFYLYPPHQGSGGSLNVQYSVLPGEVTLGDPITVPDRYKEALTDYIVYRSLSEDTDLAEPGRAEHFLGSYYKRLGIKV